MKIIIALGVILLFFSSVSAKMFTRTADGCSFTLDTKRETITYTKKACFDKTNSDILSIECHALDSSNTNYMVFRILFYRKGNFLLEKQNNCDETIDKQDRFSTMSQKSQKELYAFLNSVESLLCDLNIYMEEKD